MKKLVTYISVFLAIAAVGNAEFVKPIKGTRVIITAPSGFVAFDRFPGYVSEETGSSVMVSELPAPFAEVLWPGVARTG